MNLNPSPRPGLVAGAQFLYQGNTFRLNTFLCEMPKKPVEHELLAGLFDEWEAEEAAKLPPGMRRIKLQTCLPGDATFVSGSGTAGCVAPIEDIELVGFVDWTDKQLAEHHEKALREGREGRYVGAVLRPITQTEVV
ncbi:hypothetical protein [Pseudomonas putida]|uniref:Uncharacterized protein n=1 Tax=Pseudomonas putida TaxID=303 RepID=A0A7V8EJ34_PSEPU|nr:hypothetical protein [Pseudomonas putida]KAF0255776.1 hypothetical protein GN299_06705 [Pseudomonas putida]